ncbi:hypothetical protein [Plantactinospora sp. CA-290183]|uniref:hypothetical protein n=1 Tax=Plantactinospora sp. CA-290183 TaxID=3240006 RepID=UPI003D8E8DE2
MLIGTDDGDYQIVRQPVDGTASRVVARVPEGLGQVARVDRMQLAGELLPDLRVTEVGGPERGPWPEWWWALLTVAVAVAGWLVVRAVRRRGTSGVEPAAVPRGRPA